MRTIGKIIGIGIIAGIGYIAGNYQMISQRVNTFPESLEQRIIPPIAPLVCGGKTEPEDVARYIVEMSYDETNTRVQEFIQQLSPRARNEFMYNGFSRLSYKEKALTLQRMEKIYQVNNNENTN